MVPSLSLFVLILYLLRLQSSVLLEFTTFACLPRSLTAHRDVLLTPCVSYSRIRSNKCIVRFGYLHILLASFLDQGHQNELILGKNQCPLEIRELLLDSPPLWC
ncbi:uncharacterized protein EV420DRAFT_1534269 [Desarmillaria tabescens]|uniref:Secreted protein n=1 Tax=Armillaria tabescens TaxID=1929756 RepID=A0AA39KF20_ARMTA|nr:uncharacterized protein EV420DRAFT_1534269 [Desarmillaria tabescens]KAK0459982.1 hypothetical protein EV420DRAFT_1534269 [Desarmillaria tabescens]